MEEESDENNNDVDIERLRYDNNILKDLEHHPIVKKLIKNNSKKIKEIEK